jgi:DNA-binding response OmpR family regulator
MQSADTLTVVLVESDALVRMPLALYLRECGYRVIECASGDEALSVLDQREIRVDVVLIDAQLPGQFNGFGLLRTCTEKRPNVKAIVVGTPARAAVAATELCETGPKPGKHYDHQLIETRIRELLAERRRQSGEGIARRQVVRRR